MNKIVIDLSQMSPQEQTHLDLLLKSRPKKERYVPHKKYTYSDPTTQQTYIITLSHEILKRPCRPGGKHDGEFRFEVFKNKKNYAETGLAEVLQTIGTIVPATSEQSLHFKTGKKAFKQFNDLLTDPEIFKEYRMTPAYLKMKPPVYRKGQYGIFMKWANGDTFKRFLKFNEITEEERLPLCFSFSKAYYRQVYRNGVVHNDIKSDNIIIKKRTKNKKTAWKVTFIDFGEAKKINRNTLKTIKHSQKIDMVSLSEIFETIYQINKNKSNTPIDEDILTLIKKMSSSHSSHHPSAKEIYQFFQNKKPR